MIYLLAFTFNETVAEPMKGSTNVLGLPMYGNMLDSIDCLPPTHFRGELTVNFFFLKLFEG